jgi:L-histidine N-alpha-methyltransferase
MLSEKFPDLHIHAIVADFTHQKNIIPPGSKKLFCFFGSTIGNYPRSEALNFISHFDDSMEPGNRLLLGLDRVKNKQVVESAYNDSSNITARFNKNILSVVNDVAGTNFNTEDFDHLAFYNESLNRIEMHLKAKMKMEISSPHSKNKIVIEPNETIHTENSYKFLESDINEFQNHSGLEIEEIISDDNKWFSLVHFVKKFN